MSYLSALAIHRSEALWKARAITERSEDALLVLSDKTTYIKPRRPKCSSTQVLLEGACLRLIRSSSPVQGIVVQGLTRELPNKNVEAIGAAAHRLLTNELGNGRSLHTWDSKVVHVLLMQRTRSAKYRVSSVSDAPHRASTCPSCSNRASIEQPQQTRRSALATDSSSRLASWRRQPSCRR